MNHHHNISNHHQTHTAHLNEQKSFTPVIIVLLLLLALITGFIYLQATHVTLETLTTDCNNSDSAACLTLGDHYTNTINPDNTIDHKKAHTHYQQACNQNDPTACQHLANQYLKGIGTPKNTNKAHTLYTQLCDQHYNNACHTLGQIYENGQGLQPNHQTAKDHYQKACTANHPPACYQLANLLKHSNTIPQDPKQAIKLYRQSCEQNYAPACTALGQHYAQHPHNQAAATAYYLSACDKDPKNLTPNEQRTQMNTCYELATRYQKGIGTKPNQEQAQHYFKRITDHYQTQCNNHNDHACQQLAWHYLTSIGIKQNQTKALSLNQTICQQSQDIQVQRQSCFILGGQYLHAEGTPKNAQQGIQYLKKACGTNEPNACNYLGDIYERGLDTSRNITQAKIYHTRACTLKHTTSCQRLTKLKRTSLTPLPHQTTPLHHQRLTTI